MRDDDGHPEDRRIGSLGEALRASGVERPKTLREMVKDAIKSGGANYDLSADYYKAEWGKLPPMIALSIQSDFIEPFWNTCWRHWFMQVGLATLWLKRLCCVERACAMS